MSQCTKKYIALINRCPCSSENRAGAFLTKPHRYKKCKTEQAAWPLLRAVTWQRIISLNQFEMLVHAFVTCRLVVLLCDLSKYVIHMFQSLENFIWSYVVVNMTTLLLYLGNYIGFPWNMSSAILTYLCPSYNHHLFQTYKPVRSSRSSTMNLLISDTQIKAKTFIGRSCFFFLCP